VSLIRTNEEGLDCGFFTITISWIVHSLQLVMSLSMSVVALVTRILNDAMHFLIAGFPYDNLLQGNSLTLHNVKSIFSCGVAFSFLLPES
jgi:hypothetical protein